MIRNILVYVGFAEDQSFSAIPFTHDAGFDSVQEALSSLAKCLLNGVEAHVDAWIKDCCKNNPSSSKYCGACGSRIDEPPDVLEMRDWIDSILDEPPTQSTFECLNAGGWSRFGDRIDDVDYTNVVVVVDGGTVLSNIAFNGKVSWSNVSVPKGML